MSDYGDNIWGELEDFGDGVSGKRLVRSPDSHLVAAVWERSTVRRLPCAL